MDGIKSNMIEVGESEHTAYVKVIGRATFLLATDFKEYICKALDKGRAVFIDMSECSTTDSTFIGTITSLTVKQNKTKKGMIKIFNVSEHVLGIIETLGLKPILDIVSCKDLTFSPFSTLQCDLYGKVKVSHLMLDAHQALADLNAENEVEFKNVIDYLKNQID